MHHAIVDGLSGERPRGFGRAWAAVGDALDLDCPAAAGESGGGEGENRGSRRTRGGSHASFSLEEGDPPLNDLYRPVCRRQASTASFTGPRVMAVSPSITSNGFALNSLSAG